MTERLVLPQGDILRDFLTQSAISKSDLKRVVRRRGIFLRSDEKAETIPCLVRTGLTPSEFQFLLNLLQKKEENPKFSSQLLQNANGESSLSEALEENSNFHNVFDTNFRSYSFKSEPMIVTTSGDGNALDMSFTIVRMDFSKSFTKIDAEFEGKVSASRNPITNEINIISTHTSKETRYLCEEIAKEFISSFKAAGIVPNDTQAISIRFSDFSSEGRFRFLNELASANSGNFLQFQAISDIGFKPNSQTDKPIELSWLEDNLRSVRFRGTGLEKLKIITDKEHYSHIEAFRFESDYNFLFENTNGSCTITFDFPDYSMAGDVNAELMISVSDLRFIDADVELTLTPTKAVNKAVLERIRSSLDFSKSNLHKKYKRQFGTGENSRAV